MSCMELGGLKMDEWYRISKEELVELLYSNFKLMALESGGVDNWDWYSESINDFEERNGELYTLAREELCCFDIVKE